MIAAQLLGNGGKIDPYTIIIMVKPFCKPPFSVEENLIFEDKKGNMVNYTGEVKNGVPHGEGSGVFFSLDPPATFIGDWADGIPAIFAASIPNVKEVISIVSITERPQISIASVPDSFENSTYVNNKKFTTTFGGNY
jgi:hypothetical protein